MCVCVCVCVRARVRVCATFLKQNIVIHTAVWNLAILKLFYFKE
jgi:hypothetical protein